MSIMSETLGESVRQLSHPANTETEEEEGRTRNAHDGRCWLCCITLLVLPLETASVSNSFTSQVARGREHNASQSCSNLQSNRPNQKIPCKSLQWSL